MTGGLSTFIMLALVVISYIVSAIVQAKAKRQEEEEARQAAQERRAQAQAQAQARTGAPDQPGGAPQTRQDELAARRRAQLEELRKRRETQHQPGRSQTGTGSQTQVSTGTQQRGTRLPQTATVQRGRFESPIEHHEAPIESERIAPTSRSETRSPGRIEQQQPPAHRKQSSTGRRSGETAEHPGVPSDSPVVRGEIGAELEATESEIPEAPAAIGGDQSLIAGLRRGEFDMQRLREAIVLKEILDRPVALRSESGGT